MHLLLATDGSSGSLDAARQLATLTLPPGSRITVVTVADHAAAPGAWRGLTEACEIVAPTGATVTTDQRQGHAAEGLLEAIAHHHPDLAVVGTHGRSGIMRFLLGSVAEKVARHARSPVLVARSRKGVAPSLKRILVGLDGSTCAQETLDWLIHSPFSQGATLHLCAAVPAPVGASIAPDLALIPSLLEELEAREQAARKEARARLDAALARLAESGIAHESCVLVGHPALSLVEEAERWRADVVAVGAHGTSGMDRFLLGSVSEHVLRNAPCSVLVRR